MTQPAFLIAFFTTLVQCYDYALFGVSASILSKHFMPKCSDADQILIFYAVFALAVLARPLGSIIFGKISDTYGRIVSVKIAALVAAVSTAIIGVTPSFSEIGWFATIILTLCRMAFIMSLAGEIDATRIYVAEKIGVKRRNLANGVVSFFSQFGAVIAATSYHYSLVYENDYLWKVNFIIGGALGIVVLLLRGYFQESEEFLRYKATHKAEEKESLFGIIKLNSYKFILAALISGCAGGAYHFLIIFFSTFAAKGMEIITLDEARVMTIILTSVYSISAVFSGLLADKFNPRKQIILAIVTTLLTVTVMQLAIKYHIPQLAFIVLLVAVMPFYTIPLQIITQFVFAVDIRTRMSSISHSIGGMIFSSTTPFFCMLIWQRTRSLELVLLFFIMLLVILLTSASQLIKIKME